VEDLKYLVPLVTFALGVLFTPLVESLKHKSKINQLKLDISAELQDEFNDLAKGIKTVDKSIKTRKTKPDNFVHISLPAPIDFLVLEKHIIEIYQHSTPSQRKAYKRILDLESNIAEKRKKVLEIFNTQNFDCLSIEKAMLYEMLSLYYVMNHLLQSKDNFVFPTRGNDDVVKDAAKALQVNFPY